MSLKVKGVMVKNIVTMGARTSVEKAVDLINKHEIGCLIVVNEEKPVGIVTERDMLKRFLFQHEDPRKTRVGSIMSKPLVVGKRQTDLREAVALMVERRIKKLHVIENTNLLGLLTLTDIVRSSAYLEHIISSFCSRCPLRKD
jgi:CBS domain-containing protein